MAVEKIELPDDQVDFIREAIATGRFQNMSEFVRASVRLMIEQYDVETLTIEELRALIDEGDASGESDRTPEEIWASARAGIVRDAIGFGRFQDTSEVMRDGNRFIKDEMDAGHRNEQKLRAILDEAAAGGVGRRTPSEVFEAERAKFTAKDG